MLYNYFTRLLEKHYSKLNPGGESKKVLVPLCGMSVDMNWLADKGMTVIGVDIAEEALAKFVSLSDQDWEETAVPTLGPGAKLFTRKDGKIKLYLGDFLKFTRFAAALKNLMNPGGRMLLDAIAYDEKILEDENFKPPMPVPPPYSVGIAETKGLFEPAFTVEILDEIPNNAMYDFPAVFYAYLMVRK
ncbi:thiopurine S-methyltransferase [Elysia marginata]|uniref:Thiopurine S-methyltransferase n=1 Tax=Elysia marginata TaxID=1093978 RepID=A0AAV4FPP2_9GAST|nr:thiopurine S-methyltransferase [Elysia marginata]